MKEGEKLIDGKEDEYDIKDLKENLKTFSQIFQTLIREFDSFKR